MNRSLTFSILISLYNILVWSRKPAFVTTRIAFFCIFTILSVTLGYAEDHASILYAVNKAGQKSYKAFSFSVMVGSVLIY